jgi:hypothetical protein
MFYLLYNSSNDPNGDDYSDYISQFPPIMNVHLGLWSDNLYFNQDDGTYDPSLDYSSSFNNFIYIGADMSSTSSYTFSPTSTLSGSPFRSVSMF